MPVTPVARVLVVDDDQRLLFVLSANLRAEGYEVLLATDGREGVEAARRSLPDIIIMDVSMPGMNGVEATRELKVDPATSEIPVIMLTARSKAEDLVIGLESGADEYITKPFHMGELMARVRTMHRLLTVRRQLSATNERLAHEVTEKTQRLSLLYRFSRRLNEVESQAEILDHVVEAVQETTSAQRISILLPDEDGQHLYCARAVGLDPALARGLRIRRDAGIVGKVFSTGTTIVANARDEVSGESGRYTTDAFMSAPLISTTLMTGDEVIGVLNATEKADASPFSPEEAECVRSIADMAAVALHNQIRRSRLEDFVKVLLWTVGRLAEFRDEETSDHLERVQRYADLLASALRSNPKYRSVVTDEYIRNLVLSTPLHDIGKVGIPDDILLKAGRLTPQEFEVMKTHVEIGRKTLEFVVGKTGTSPLLRTCIEVVSGHHEKYNGTGYPLGLRGEAIPLAARIVALADAYDAITSRRPYKAPLPHEQAIEIIRAESGEHFDPDIVAAFLSTADEFDRIRCQSQGDECRPELAAASV